MKPRAVAPEELINRIRGQETIEEFHNVLRVIANSMAAPLFLLFWMADIIYVPHLKWEFLIVRLLVIPLCMAISMNLPRLNDINKLNIVAPVYTFLLAMGINYMIFRINSPGTGYYAGLNLVAIGTLSFMPLSIRKFILTAFFIYLPYYLIALLQVNDARDTKHVAINTFFIASSICICFLIRHFNEKLRRKEVESRINLENELINRDKIIREKTAEGVLLTSLSNQFSPQVIEAIKNGKIELSTSGQRTQISSIFIDIVNSTERVTRIDKDKIQKVLERFLDDSIKILLAYDITIDKFLGDGLLGFCNAPIPKKDYIERTVRAAIEIREKIKENQDFYEQYWQKPLEIRVGIAKGFATVGFYGSKKYFRSFTAIGPVVNLASRLCTSANTNQILVDFDVFQEVQESFSIQFVDKRTLKGFHDDVIYTYEVIGFKNADLHVRQSANECSQCGSLLSLETNEQGHFVFTCKFCGNTKVAQLKAA